MVSTKIIKDLILAIGPTTQNNKLVNGQSMMFQLIVDYFIDSGRNFKLLDIGLSKFCGKETVSGKFSVQRMLDYTLWVFEVFFIYFFCKVSVLYLTTSQSKVGFIRDWFFINIANLFRSRLVLHQYGSNYSNFYQSQSSFWQTTIKKTLSKADRIIVEGQFSKEQFSFLDDYESKVLVVSNGLPERNLKIPNEPKRLDGSQVKLFYLSNLIESKGYLDVLKAFELLKNKYKRNVSIVFAGKFLEAVDDETFTNQLEAKQYFDKFILENNLGSEISYFSGLYGEAKAEHFTNSKFFLLPSYYINEGQPVSILEAMAYGCVPVVTEYRLIPSMVTRENGIFVHPRSPEDIAEKINNVLNNPELYLNLSSRCQSDYQEKFTPLVFCKKVDQILNKA